MVSAQDAPKQEANPKSKSAQKIAKKKEEREKEQTIGEAKAKKHQLKSRIINEIFDQSIHKCKGKGT